MESEQINLLNLIITIFLVLLNGFFVAAEFAIVKVRSSQLELNSKSISQKAALKIVQNLDGYLAATQLGITLASLALGWVGEETVKHIVMKVISMFSFIDIEQQKNIANKVAFPLGFFIITFLHIVIGELVPKSIAIRHPYKTTLFVTMPLKIFRSVFYPFIVFFNGTGNFILKMMGIKTSEEGDIHSEEELKLLISESAEGGAIEDSERELIQNVFEFDDRLVKQIFIHNSKVEGIAIDSSIEDSVKNIFEQGYSRYPIYNNSLDNIIGMAHSKDILKSFIKKDGKKLSDLKRDVLYINENKRVLDLLRLFQLHKTEFGVVVDEFGSTIGIITMEDILEELVGEIQDEHDNEADIVEKINDNVYRIYSLNSIDDINEYLPIPIPKLDSYETLSGYIATLSKELPMKDDIVEGNDFIFKILTMKRKSPEVVEMTIK